MKGYTTRLKVTTIDIVDRDGTRSKLVCSGHLTDMGLIQRMQARKIDAVPDLLTKKHDTRNLDIDAILTENENKES